MSLFIVVCGLLLLLVVQVSAESGTTVASAAAARSDGMAATSPIQHVILIVEENHSFDNILGKFCANQAKGLIVRAGSNMACDGATTATLSTGATYDLTESPDYGYDVSHSVVSMIRDMNGGAMNQWDSVLNCKSTSKPPYVCLTQFDPTNGPCGADGTQTCIPNIVQYAKDFAISDRTFSYHPMPSWTGHMVFGAATVEQFEGSIPKKYPGDPGGPGWGCDGGKESLWYISGNSGPTEKVPSCIPNSSGSLGPLWAQYTGPTADYVPTIFDRLDAAGLSWKIYGGGGSPTKGGYIWTICPTFWECRGSSQFTNLVPNKQLPVDAAAGDLPAVSYVIPTNTESAHEPQSTAAGDHWIGSVVSAIMQSPEWSSSAIVVTYDDCGCFYDHVNPLQYNPEWGPRLPLLIISPWAKPGYTDSTPASVVSLLTFIEHNFDLPALDPCETVGASDPNCTDDLVGPNGGPAYDYMGAFDFNQTPLAPVPLLSDRLPAEEQRWLAAHPNAGNDPT
jgi:phospholipase C